MFSYKSYLLLDEFTGIDPMTIANKGYELENLEFTFRQKMDDKGKASSEVCGGTFVLDLPTLPKPQIIEWGLNPRMYRKGVIVMLDNQNVPMDKIFFENAACVNMTINYLHVGKAYASTKLIIHAESLVMDNGIDFNNEWVK